MSSTATTVQLQQEKKTVVIKAFDSDAGVVRNFDFVVPECNVFDQLKSRALAELGIKQQSDASISSASSQTTTDDDDGLQRYRKSTLYFNATLGDGVFLLRSEEHVRELLDTLDDGDPIGVVVSLFVEGERRRTVLVKCRLGQHTIRGVDKQVEFLFSFCASRPGTFAALKRACVENMGLLNTVSAAIAPAAASSSSSSSSSLLEVDVEACAPTGEWTLLTSDLDACRCMLEYALDISCAFVWVRLVRAPEKPKKRAVGVEVMYQGTIAAGTFAYTDSFFRTRRPNVALISSFPSRGNSSGEKTQPKQNIATTTGARAVSNGQAQQKLQQEEDDDEEEDISVALPEENVWLNLRKLCLALHDLPESATVTILRAVTATEQPMEKPIADDAAAREHIIRARATVPSVLHLRMEKGIVGTYPVKQRGSISVHVQVVRDNRAQFLQSKRAEYEARMKRREELIAESGSGRRPPQKSLSSSAPTTAPAAVEKKLNDENDDPLRVRVFSFEYDPECAEVVAAFRHFVLTRSVDSDVPYTFWVALSDVETGAFTHPASVVQEARRREIADSVKQHDDDYGGNHGGNSSSGSNNNNMNNNNDGAAATNSGCAADDEEDADAIARSCHPALLRRHLRPAQSLEDALAASMMAGTDSVIAECLRVAFETQMPAIVKLVENQADADLLRPSSQPVESTASSRGKAAWEQSKHAATGGWKSTTNAVETKNVDFDALMAGFSQGFFSNRETELRALAQEWEDVTGGADNTTQGGGLSIAAELFSIMMSWSPQPRPPTAAAATARTITRTTTKATATATRAKDDHQTSDIVHRGTADAAFAELMGLLRSVRNATTMLGSQSVGNNSSDGGVASGMYPIQENTVADPMMVESLCDGEKLFSLIQSWTLPLSDADVSAFTQYCRAAIAAFADVSPQTKLRVLLARAFRAHSTAGVVHSSFLRRSIAATVEDVSGDDLSRLLDDYRRLYPQYRSFARAEGEEEEEEEADGDQNQQQRQQIGTVDDDDFVLPRHAFDEIVTFLSKGDAHAVSRLFSFAAAKRPIEVRPSTAEHNKGVAREREMHLRHNVRHAMDAITLEMCLAFAAECEEQAVKAVTPPDIWTRVAWATAALLRNPLAAQDTPADCSHTWKWLRRILASETSATDLLFALKCSGWSHAAHDVVAKVGQVSLATEAEPRLLLPVSPVLSSLSEWCRNVAELTCIVNNWSWPPVTSDAAATGRWGRPSTAAGNSVGSVSGTPFATTPAAASARARSVMMPSPSSASRNDDGDCEAAATPDPQHRGSPPRRAVFRIPLPPPPPPATTPRYDDSAEAGNNDNGSNSMSSLHGSSRRFDTSFKHLCGRGDYSLTRESRPTARQLSSARKDAMARAAKRDGERNDAAAAATTPDSTQRRQEVTVDLNKLLRHQAQDLAAMRERLAKNPELTNAPLTKAELSKNFVSGIFQILEKEQSVRSMSSGHQLPPDNKDSSSNSESTANEARDVVAAYPLTSAAAAHAEEL